MSVFEVKFGTPEPIKFREYDKDRPQIDLDLECRAAGRSVVSAYDSALYEDDEAVKSAAKEIALSSIKDCICAWPEGKSFWKNTTKTVLEKRVDERLADCGITAETELFSLALTSESRELYHSAVEEANKQSPYVDFIDQYRNIVDGNEGQPRVGGNIIPNMIGLHNPFMPSSDDRGMKIADNVDLSNPPRDLERMYSGLTDKYCRQCGTKRPEYAKYCPECGAKYL